MITGTDLESGLLDQSAEPFHVVPESSKQFGGPIDNFDGFN